ncbi:cupin domain-containing protein [Arenicellales bacterium nBUS_48]
MNKTFEEPPRPAALILPGSESLIWRTNNIDWQACDESGFWVKPLIEDDSKMIRTCLMKIDASAFSDLHAHDEYEQIYVLSGSFYDQDSEYGAGDLIVRAPGTLHTAGSKTGATVLLFYSPA